MGGEIGSRRQPGYRGLPAVGLDGSVAAETTRQALIQAHLPLVRSVARRYAGRGEELDDLVQVGAVGLVKASERFDPDRGVAFATFVAPAIEGEILRHLGDRARLLRIPRELQRMGAKLHRSSGELTATLGHSPSVRELAVALGIDEHEVERVLEAERARDSVTISGDEQEVELVDGAEALAGSDDRMLLARGLRALDRRERRIVFLRFHADMTERQISEAVGISQAHVSRLLDGALGKLRDELGTSAGPSARGGATRGALKSPPDRPPGARKQKALVSGSADSLFAGGEPSDSRIAEVAADQVKGKGSLNRTRRPAAGSKPQSTYSGRFLVRIPSELHEQLTRAAERDDVSLNRFVTDALASSVSSAADQQPEAKGSAVGSEGRNGPVPRGVRRLRVALAANLVVGVLAAVAAVVLLMLALQRGI